MKRIASYLLFWILVLSLVLSGCASSDTASSDGISSTSESDVADNSSFGSSSAVTPVEPPEVKNVITEIQDGGTGTAAADAISKEEISITPPDYTTVGSVVYNDIEDRSTLLSAGGTNEAEYQSYLDNLESLGYTKIMSDRQIVNTDNKASVYSNGRFLISTNYIASGNTAKIAIDELGLETVEDVNEYLSVFDADFSARSNITEPLLISTGLSVSEDKNAEGYYNTGLSYILRLSDGSFIIIDGGDINSVNDHSGRLFAVLKHYAPDKNNIRIAAWIITHPHSDHAKAFTEFYGNYINGTDSIITLEKVIANIPDYSTAVAATSEGQLLLNDTLRGIFSSSKANGTDVYKAHTGQVYNFPGATFEMLYTYDVTLPQKMAKGMDNTYSLCFNISFEGKIIHINGDATSVNIIAMNTMYGENLKCDIVQVPHHGTVSNFKSSSDPEKQASNFDQLTKFYTEYTRPSYAIWPSTKRGRDYYLGLDVSENPNAVLKALMPTGSIYANGDNVKEFRFSSSGVQVTEYSFSGIGY